MTLFYFIRHGKTEINAEGRFNGGTVDSPLVPEGIEATKKIAQYLKDVSFDLALSSPQLRAQTTAKIILKEHDRGPKLTIVEDLREMRLGDWDGEKISEITKQYPEDIRDYRTRPDLFDSKKFHSESYAEVIRRSTQVIKEITKQYPEGNILVVSHGILLMALLNTLKGMSLAEIRQGGIVDNSSLTIMASEGSKVTFHTWGETF
ncbi:histidine phosphatase family protein [Enterococcus hermanniensis]|uniref:histidine phosphatase family protein n=1 Tax=Enterococcus hermanniensis TaxID=249189 RepID=UPI000A5FB4BD|nr:histidine phosphatase family protein [Enterococcus hermanniensis]